MARFDDIEALIRKIRLGEDSLLELKQVGFKGRRVDAPKRQELADELAAFANTRGGALLLGIDDHRREVLGMSLEELDLLETWIRQIVNDNIEPPLLAHIERLELPGADGTLRPVLGIEVLQSLFVHKSPGGYFHRLGSSKREMRPELLARLFQERSQARLIRFEEQAVPDTRLDDLTEGLWSRFLGPLSDDPQATLRKLGLLVKDSFGVERVSVAGVLLASEHPEKHLPGALIEAVRYRGTEQDTSSQTDARSLTGPLDQQIRDAMAFFRRNMTVAATKDRPVKTIPSSARRRRSRRSSMPSPIGTTRSTARRSGSSCSRIAWSCTLQEHCPTP